MRVKINNDRLFLLPLFSVLVMCCSLSVYAGIGKELYQVSSANLKIVVDKGAKAERLVDILVSYPQGDANYPLIVFSHGHFLDNQSYQNLTDHWVAAGYIVIAPKHIDSGDMATVSAMSQKVGSDWVSASRLLELSSIISNAEKIMDLVEDFNGTVLSNRVIAAGHSLGALSSQHLAGAEVERKNNSIHSIPDTLVDDRIVGVVAISPPGLMPGHITEKTWVNFSKPQLVVTGTNDFFPSIWPDYQDHFVSYKTAVPGANYLLVYDQVDHYFGNLIGRLTRPVPSQEQALKNLQEVSLVFIESSLNDDYEELDTLINSSKPEGVLRFERR